VLLRKPIKHHDGEWTIVNKCWKEKELNILKPFLTAALSQIAKESYAMVAHLVISG
jgi:hypothetical protein